ncbi:MAG: hypothetical protein NC833_01340 [Candidatus Omnitrophica bacterium]|nr:hypothetical protein [Candidatus Omnitrophota bacterium]
MKKQKTSSLIKVMDEKEIKEEFLPQLKNATKNIFGILSQFNSKYILPPRELSFALMKEADEVETFLDEFGANQNKRFFLFREMVATTRWFNFFLFQGLHLYARIKHYKLQITQKEYIEFKKDLRKNLIFAYKVIRNIGKKLFEESESIGLKKSKNYIYSETLFPQIQRKILPPDIDEEITKEQEERIFEILIKYLNVCEEFNLFLCYRQDKFLKEEPIEKYRSLFHQLESLYDTYIKNTNYEIEISDFQKIRGHIAVSWHLLEMAKALAHFYERHIEKLSHSEIYYKIIECIGDEKKIRDIVEKFSLRYALEFSLKGEKICERIFSKMGKKPEDFLVDTRILIIPSHRVEDFHIRPIMPVTQIANKHHFDSFLYFNRKKYNLKSPIEIAIAIPDIRETLIKENVQIVIQGSLSAVNEIVEFFKEKVGAVEKILKCENLLTK